MNTPEHVVVVGGGLAGAKTVEALLDLDYQGSITIVGAEQHAPYERPPLSKDYLAGKSTFDEALVHPLNWYTENGVTLKLSTRVTSIDTHAQKARLDDGSSLEYDKLVLATGSVVRRLPIPGSQATGVHYLRTIEDADAIRSTFGADKKLVIIGAGWIGLEVAAAARASGTAVTVIEASELPLLAVLGPELAEVFADLHRENGVDLRVNARTSEIATENGAATGVRLDDGETIFADPVVVGIGVAPDITLAQQSRLGIDNGILVDPALRTTDPNIYAVGDIANHDHPILGRRIRVEHWANALNQPAVAAASLLGSDAQYTELPYFFSDQYDLGMEYIGHAPRGSYDRVVVRGDLDSREFVAFWLSAEDRILAAMNVNVWDVVEQLKPIIAGGKHVDSARLGDPTVPYSEL